MDGRISGWGMDARSMKNNGKNKLQDNKIVIRSKGRDEEKQYPWFSSIL